MVTLYVVLFSEHCISQVPKQLRQTFDSKIFANSKSTTVLSELRKKIQKTFQSSLQEDDVLSAL